MNKGFALLLVFFLVCFIFLFFVTGTIHAVFEKSNNHYTWKKVNTTVHNIIVGKLWIDQVRRSDTSLQGHRA